MDINYITIQLNKPPEKVRKPPQVLRLSNVYKTLKTNSFPMKARQLTIDKIELCANSQGCTPKSSRGVAFRDYTVAFKDQNRNIVTDRTLNNDSQAVLLKLFGSFTYNNRVLKLAIRVPRSGVVGIQVGMTASEFPTRNQNADSLLNELVNSIGSQVANVIPQFSLSSRPALVGMKIGGFNVFNPKTGERAQSPIKNFKVSMKALDDLLESHSLDMVDTDAKQLIKANFKPKVRGDTVTVSITRYGMVDFLGLAPLRIINRLADQLVRYMQLVPVQFESSRPTPKPSTSTGKCARGAQPASRDGVCNQPSKVAVPNKKGDALCCVGFYVSKSGKL